MSFRKTGAFLPAVEIEVLTCDICERDIGFDDGSRPRPHLSVARHPNAGGLGDQSPTTIVCSRECLSAFAAKLEGLEREPATPQSGGPGARGKKPRG